MYSPLHRTSTGSHLIHLFICLVKPPPLCVIFRFCDLVIFRRFLQPTKFPLCVSYFSFTTSLSFASYNNLLSFPCVFHVAVLRPRYLWPRLFLYLTKFPLCVIFQSCDLVIFCRFLSLTQPPLCVSYFSLTTSLSFVAYNLLSFPCVFHVAVLRPRYLRPRLYNLLSSPFSIIY